MDALRKLNHPSHLLMAIILISTAISDSAASASEEPKFSFYPKVTVTLWNALPEWSMMMTHCKSADDDLGFGIVVNGSSYSWSFHPTYWGTTLFSCVVNVRDHGRVGFNAYDFNRDYEKQGVGRCDTECTWNATLDGVHGFNQHTRSFDIYYPWGI